MHTLLSLYVIEATDTSLKDATASWFLDGGTIPLQGSLDPYVNGCKIGILPYSEKQWNQCVKIFSQCHYMNELEDAVTMRIQALLFEWNLLKFGNTVQAADGGYSLCFYADSLCHTYS